MGVPPDDLFIDRTNVSLVFQCSTRCIYIFVTNALKQDSDPLLSKKSGQKREKHYFKFVSNISKTSASVSSGFPNTRKQMKARSRRPSAFIVFECLESPMKHEARVFEIASQSKLKLRSRKRNKIVKIYAN